MESKVKKWGNSMGVRIPSYMLKEIGLDEDSAIEVTLEGETITIRKYKEPEKKWSIAEAFQEYGEVEEPVEKYDWGEPVGKELW